MDLPPSDQRAFEDFLFHKEGGYTYDRDGYLGSLSRDEEQRFIRGWQLWQKHVENPGQKEQNKKPGQRATTGDHAAFDEFAADVNTQ